MYRIGLVFVFVFVFVLILDLLLFSSMISMPICQGRKNNKYNLKTKQNWKVYFYIA